MTEEDEEFNRIERETSMRKAAVIAAIAKRNLVGLTDEEKQEWVEAMPDEPKPRHIMNLINVIEVELERKNK